MSHQGKRWNSCPQGPVDSPWPALFGWPVSIWMKIALGCVHSVLDGPLEVSKANWIFHDFSLCVLYVYRHYHVSYLYIYIYTHIHAGYIMFYFVHYIYIYIYISYIYMWYIYMCVCVQVIIHLWHLWYWISSETDPGNWQFPICRWCSNRTCFIARLIVRRYILSHQPMLLCEGIIKSIWGEACLISSLVCK